MSKNKLTKFWAFKTFAGRSFVGDMTKGAQVTWTDYPENAMQWARLDDAMRWYADQVSGYHTPMYVMPVFVSKITKYEIGEPPVGQR